MKKKTNEDNEMDILFYVVIGLTVGKLLQFLWTPYDVPRTTIQAWLQSSGLQEYMINTDMQQQGSFLLILVLEFSMVSLKTRRGF